jgi:hypothetical protein
MTSLEIKHVESITSAQDFIRSVLNLRDDEILNRKLLYRGVPNSKHDLKPGIGREQKYAGGEPVTFTRDQEVFLLHRFRRRAYPHFQRALISGEAIFIAQHHGLPTRLLDWTANALFALYFACWKHLESDGKVWATAYQPGRNYIDVFDVATKWGDDELFAAADAIRLVHPLYNTTRVLAQDGAFTLHFNPWESIEGYHDKGHIFDDEKLDIEMLRWWSVPKDYKPTIIKELSGLGITHRALFPDLDGIAKSLWETAVLWNENDRQK